MRQQLGKYKPSVGGMRSKAPGPYRYGSLPDDSEECP